MRTINALLAICFFTCLSCKHTKSVLSKKELVSFINEQDHAVLKEQEVNDINVKVQYQPSSLLVAQELAINTAKDSKTIDSLERKYSSNYYFLLKFSKHHKEAIRQLGSFDRYSDMVSVLSFELPRFLNVTTPQRDTIELSDYFFDQTYGAGDANTVLLAFAKEKLKGKSMFEINLGECGFGIGNLKFSFRKEDLERVPQLNYNSL